MNKLFQSSVSSITTDALVLHGWVDRIEPDNDTFVLRRGMNRTTIWCGPELGDAVSALRMEWVVRLHCQAQPDKDSLHCISIEVLNRAEGIPFTAQTRSNAAIGQRARYRYLEFRDPTIQEFLRLRHCMHHAVSCVLDAAGYVSLETPILATRSGTGAAEFKVSSRRNDATWALPQSPQIYGHLAVIGGIDAYYQWSRCFRDEDLRANRQPEFTQLHLELAFVERADLMQVVESVVQAAVAAAGQEMPAVIPQVSYDDAMRRFGSDKPDLRFAPSLTRLPVSIPQHEERADLIAFRVEPPSGICLEEVDLAALRQVTPRRAQCLGFASLQSCTLKPTMTTDELTHALQTSEQPTDAAGCTVWLIEERQQEVLYLSIYRWLEANKQPPNELSFTWIVDFPLFISDPDNKGRLVSYSHPFTAPTDETALKSARSNKEMLSLIGKGFDLVLNGDEVGSGSILNHRHDLQLNVLQRLGLSKSDIRDQFGFLLDAIRYGSPPLGGFGLGWDRLVALVAGTDKIRDVIAFPKTKQGYCPVTEREYKKSNNTGVAKLVDAQDSKSCNCAKEG